MQFHSWHSDASTKHARASSTAGTIGSRLARQLVAAGAAARLPKRGDNSPGFGGSCHPGESLDHLTSRAIYSDNRPSRRMNLELFSDHSEPDKKPVELPEIEDAKQIDSLSSLTMSNRSKPITRKALARQHSKGEHNDNRSAQETERRQNRR